MKKKDLYLIKGERYCLCYGKPQTTEPYNNPSGGKNYYLYSGCDCIPIPEDALVNVSMNTGDEPIPVKLLCVGNGNLKKEVTKKLIKNKHKTDSDTPIESPRLKKSMMRF